MGRNRKNRIEPKHTIDNYLYQTSKFLSANYRYFKKSHIGEIELKLENEQALTECESILRRSLKHFLQVFI